MTLGFTKSVKHPLKLYLQEGNTVPALWNDLGTKKQQRCY